MAITKNRFRRGSRAVLRLTTQTTELRADPRTPFAGGAKDCPQNFLECAQEKERICNGRGDLIAHNLITGFGTGISISKNSRYNVFRGNTIVFLTTDINNLNETNQDIDNVSVPLP